MHFTNTARDLGRRDAVTHSPTRDRVSLRHRVHDDCSFAHAVELGHRDVFDLCAFTRVENVLVNLIGEAECIELLTKSGNELHLFETKDFSRGIVGIANDDRFGLLVERCS